MPITLANADKPTAFRVRGKSATGNTDALSTLENNNHDFLRIGPALPTLSSRVQQQRIGRRSYSTLGVGGRSKTLGGHHGSPDMVASGHPICLETGGNDGKLQVCRGQKEREKCPDKISLDRRGLSAIPNIIGEPTLRLLSLQHNLINHLDGLQGLELTRLVFLDVYDNQIDKISHLETIKCLKVLLMGKNRIKRVEGLTTLTKLEVLDLHGNQISAITGLNTLSELKVLNLAGNQIRIIGLNDLKGLICLRELNLKRNRLKKALGFGETPQLIKLFLSNNDLQSVEDISSIGKSANIREISIENNPVSSGGECVSFFVSYLPNLTLLSQMQVTDQVRKAAMAWRKNKETSDSSYLDITNDSRREEVISNARTNWELLRSQGKCLTSNPPKSLKDLGLKPECDFVVTSVNDKKVKKTDNKHKIKKLASQESNDFFRLPPILVPIINNLNDSCSNNSIKRCESMSSVNPNVDSSSTSASLHDSTDSDESEIVSKFKKKVNKSSDVLSNSDPNSNKVTHSETWTSTENETCGTHNFNGKMIRPARFILRRRPGFRMTHYLQFPNQTITHLKPGCTGKNVKLNKTNIVNKISDSDQTLNNKNTERIDKIIENVSANKVNGSTDVTQLKKIDKNGPETSADVPETCLLNKDDSDSKTNKSCEKNDNSSTISLSNSNLTTSSKSSSDTNTQKTEESGRSVRSAISRNRNANYKLNYRAMTAKPKSKQVSEENTCTNQGREKEQGGDYLIEICGRFLNIYGQGALRFIDKPWNPIKAADVTHIKFSYISFNSIVGTLNRLKQRFPNAENFIFRETNISVLGQLNALADTQGITSLQIDEEGNPITQKVWQSYAVFRLAHWGLKTVNEKAVTEATIAAANEEYRGLSDLVLHSLPEAPLQPLLARLRLDGTALASQMSAKQWLWKADEALRNVVAKEAMQWRRTSNNPQEDMLWRQKGRNHLSKLVDHTCDAVLKLQRLESEWPSMLVEMIQNTLIDYATIDAYVKEKLQELQNQ